MRFTWPRRKRYLGMAALGLISLGLLAVLALGCTGAQGPTGPQGATGPQGPAGATGPAGAPGKDAPVTPGVGLKMTITKVEVPADRKPVVTFTLTDASGVPLRLSDLDGNPAFNISHLKQDPATKLTEWVSYSVSDVKGAAYTLDGEQRQPVLAEVKGRPSTDPLPAPVPTWPTPSPAYREVSAGTYVRTFTNALPEGYDKNATHRLAGQATRQARVYAANPVFDFVPAGGNVSQTRQVVAAASCNQCHDPLAVHGGSRRDTAYCVTCHNQQNVDPETGNSLDLKVMVHRIHRSEELPSVEAGTPYVIVGYQQSINDFSEVTFPQDVRNCTTCHGAPAGMSAEDYAKLAPQADNWKTAPSRAACGACHDQIDWTTGKDKYGGDMDHGGGPQTSDANCAACHGADTGLAPISVVHKVEPPDFKNTVSLELAPPANGKFYVAGEAPKLAITVKNAETGATIDPSTIVEPVDAANVQANEWRRANLFVSGPRGFTMPVLTTEALAPTPQYYPENDLRVGTDPAKADPRITRTSTGIVYQLADVKDLTPGTYTAFVEVMPSAPLGGWAMLNFQVGTATAEGSPAANCTTCHGDSRMHGAYFAVQFNPDICKSCHDYNRQGEGAGWEGLGWNGYGASPLVKKVHGVHASEELQDPEDLVPTAQRAQIQFAVTFPGQLQNCAKCHNQTTSWKAKPSRLACLACHDSDVAKSHAALQSDDPTPLEFYNEDGVETCSVCHGTGREFAPDAVHKPAYLAK